MFLILKSTDWKEEDYIKYNIVPFGWVENNNRAIPSNEGIFTKVQTEEQRNFLLEKLNNKYTLHLRSKYVWKRSRRIQKRFEVKVFLSEPQLDLACQGFKDGYSKCNAKLVKAKKIIKEMLSILSKENIEGIYEITEEAEQFIREVE